MKPTKINPIEEQIAKKNTRTNGENKCNSNRKCDWTEGKCNYKFLKLF